MTQVPPDPVVTQSMLYVIGAVAAFVAASTATVTLFIVNGNARTRLLLYRVISRHNKEDDDRFEQLHTEIWRLHVRNAGKDGTRAPHFKPLPRRRYLIEDGNEEDVAEPAE